jgi:hypothetical protein
MLFRNQQIPAEMLKNQQAAQANSIDRRSSNA